MHAMSVGAKLEVTKIWGVMEYPPAEYPYPSGWPMFFAVVDQDGNCWKVQPFSKGPWSKVGPEKCQ